MAIPAILETQVITSVVRKYTFPESFLSDRLDWLFPEVPVEGDHAALDVIETTSEVPTFVGRGSSSKMRGMSGRSQILVRMPYIKESIFISADEANNLRKVGTTSRATRAIDVLGDELAITARRIHAAKELAIWRALSTNFQLVINDVLTTIESPYPADNTPDVSATAPWSTSSTDIRGQLRDWTQVAVKATGLTPDTIFLNGNTWGYVLGNALAQKFLAGTERGAQLIEGLESYRLFGKTWIVWDFYYTDPWDGASKPYIPDNMIIMVPSTSDWSEFQVGEVAYINDDGKEAIDHGPRSYTVLEKDPVGYTVHTVWCGLPVVKKPEAVIIATVAS